MAKTKKLETKKEVSMTTIEKDIALLQQCEFSLRQGKKMKHANAVSRAVKLLNSLHNPTDPRLIYVSTLYGALDSIEDKGLSDEEIQKVRESPLGRKPKACYKLNEPPPEIFTLKDAQLQAISFYKRLTSRKDRKPRYTLLTFCGATPEQAYRWRDWSLKHFQLILDYLFNPEPLAEGLVNNRLGLSEEGLKSVAVA